MGVERKNQTTATAARTENGSAAKKTLGFFNLNMATRSGNPIRVDAIRFIEGNKTHEQLAAYLGLAREGDDKFVGDEARAAEKARRLVEVVAKLEFSFNPTRTDEESMLDLV